MVDAAQSSISNYYHDTDEYRVRYISWRGLKRSFTGKQEKHLANVTEYDSAVAHEERIRDKIKEVCRFHQSPEERIYNFILLKLID